MKRPVVSAILIAVVTASVGFGNDAAVFDLESAVAHSTHIVVVTDGEEIDGDVTVVESWRGDLDAGDTFTLPELAVYAAPERRGVPVHPDEWCLCRTGFPRSHPGQVDCQRMILFLVRDDERKWKAGPWAGDGWVREWQEGERRKFAVDAMELSIVWIEHGQAFAIDQPKSPGPLEIVPLCSYSSEENRTGITEDALRFLVLQSEPNLHSLVLVPEVFASSVIAIVAAMVVLVATRHFTG